ncbi:MAG: helix-turn-helix transcriptional regulator [Microbacterium sp.]
MPRKPSAAAAHIGSRITQVRRKKTWTQDQLAVESGIDSASIRSYENGRAMVNVRTLIRIATALQTDAGWFLEGLSDEQFDEPREVFEAKKTA